MGRYDMNCLDTRTGTTTIVLLHKEQDLEVRQDICTGSGVIVSHVTPYCALSYPIARNQIPKCTIVCYCMISRPKGA